MRSPIIDRFVALAAVLWIICAMIGATAAQTQDAATDPAATPQYPPNDGFQGEPTLQMLQPGAKIDRYGGTPVSRFFSPQGTPLEARALPPDTATKPLRTFEVLKETEVKAGTVAPWYGQPGLGTQYRTSLQLGELLEQGYLQEITP